MSLPDCGGDFAALPYRDSPYPATLDEIEEHFVEKAPEPTRDRRRLIMEALRLHVKLVWRLAAIKGADVRILLDGGFVTWKPKDPQDADFAVLVSPQVYPEFVKPTRIPLWTLSDVDATLGTGGGTLHLEVLKPGFGLMDSYVNPDLPATRAKWHRDWSRARDLTTGETVDGPQKGYVEVVKNDG